MVMTSLVRTPKQLGEAIRRYRQLAKLNQAQLASKAGLRQATVSEVEGGNAATRIETISKLLAALDLELTIAPRSKGFVQDVEDIF
jgi:HTH-type transcriptional regulator / antitoxin HipB